MALSYSSSGCRMSQCHSKMEFSLVLSVRALPGICNPLDVINRETVRYPKGF